MIKKVIAIVGATNSGKTALAVKLAKEINGVIISADSRQIYRGLDVGTNKEGKQSEFLGYTSRIIEEIPQLLIDQMEITQKFTLNDWLILAKEMIDKLWKNGNVPIVVGGTGLYITALLEGYVPGSGRHAKIKNEVDFNSIILSPKVSRDELFKKSDQRIERIFDRLVEETRQLRTDARNIGWLKTIGLDYKFASDYLDGLLTKPQAIEQLKKASRAYIRRQQTWWRHHGTIHEIENYSKLVELVDNFLND
ncbi:hypothetical protein HY844_02180 [Candidatus Berkelbacteria bacterium]|nr:hypothetical protein [Candidatus Berkelbacteria bacterium]